jgi:hypothetical protein
VSANYFAGEMPFAGEMRDERLSKQAAGVGAQVCVTVTAR